MNTIVTGAAGFIGQNLTKRLLDLGHKVIGIDNFSTGDKSVFKKFSEEYKDNFLSMPFDVTREDSWRTMLTVVHRFFRDQKDIMIYHLACPASPPAYQKYPLRTLDTSYLGTRNCLEFAASVNAKFLFASTSEVYGNPSCNPQSEEYHGDVNTVGPRACYDEGKRVAETLCYEYNKSMGTDVTIVRIFNTYGPGMKADDGRVVSNFINQAITGKELTIYGDGSQTRSFCFVSDMVSGLILAMGSKHFGPINLGNPNEIAVSKLANIVVKKCNTQNNIIYYPLPQDDPCIRRPNINKAKWLLGWVPEVSLDEGLDRTIRYFRGLSHVDPQEPLYNLKTG